MTRPQDTPVMPLSRELAEKLDVEPIPELQPIQNSPFRPRRQDLWPADVWEEMEAIRRGEKP